MSHSSSAGGASPPRVIPAQLSYLAIYNPSLGPTDETFADQLVFYYSRVAHEKFRRSSALARKSNRRDTVIKNTFGNETRAREDGAKDDGAKETELDEDAAQRREEENEKLRRIGLVQGMIGFARTFAGDEAGIEGIETEKTRGVVKELEKGWWVVAVVELTRLPSLKKSGDLKSPLTTSSSGLGMGTGTGMGTGMSAKRKGDGKKGKHDQEGSAAPNVEYSSREVSPPALLLQQITQAHSIFALHHGPSLSELYTRLGRERFGNALERFWTRFVRTWNVLLHGNPAVDILGGLKLASGGELGFGVGEEDWGSGEREVLEDMVRRTEGMVDLVVSRFGDPARATSNTSYFPDSESLPWLGSGAAPVATDGVVFGGTGRLSRTSLKNVSLWIRHVYTFGEYAYGVRDNPSREPRKRRRKPVAVQKEDESEGKDMTKDKGRKSKHNVGSSTRASSAEDGSHSRSKPSGIESGSDAQAEARIPAIPAGIPPPIVSADETISEMAATSDTNGKSSTTTSTDDDGTTLGIPDYYMKYLTFGLSSLAKSNQAKRPTIQSRNPSTTSGLRQHDSHVVTPTSRGQNEPMTLTNVEPIPDGERLAAKIVRQKHLENTGHFMIGLKGDLNDAPENQPEPLPLDDSQDDSEESRVVLRTIHVEVLPNATSENANDYDHRVTKSKSRAAKSYRRLRVLLYVKRPFVFCLLFEDRTSSLQYTHFYKELHKTLDPIHRPLLSSTDVSKVAQRIAAAQSQNNDAFSNSIPTKSPSMTCLDVYHLIYDPRTITLHTSVPNIPDPGTPAAEGIIEGRDSRSTSSTAWTRIDALNVHHQILNTLAHVRRKPDVLECTSKTGREWWIVYLRFPPNEVKPSTETARSSLDRSGDGAATRPPLTTQVSQGSTTSAQSDKTLSSSTLPAQSESSHSQSGLESPSEDIISASRPSSSQTRQQTQTPTRHTVETAFDMHRIAFVVRKSRGTDNILSPSSHPASSNALNNHNSANANQPSLATSALRMSSGLFSSGFSTLSSPFRASSTPLTTTTEAEDAVTQSLARSHDQHQHQQPRSSSRAQSLRRQDGSGGAQKAENQRGGRAGSVRRVERAEEESKGGIGFDARKYIAGILSLNR